jgi:hypothetical protein
VNGEIRRKWLWSVLRYYSSTGQRDWGKPWKNHTNRPAFGARIKPVWELSHIAEQHPTASTDIHGYDKSTA